MGSSAASGWAAYCGRTTAPRERLTPIAIAPTACRPIATAAQSRPEILANRAAESPAGIAASLNQPSAEGWNGTGWLRDSSELSVVNVRKIQDFIPCPPSTPTLRGAHLASSSGLGRAEEHYGTP